MTTYRFRWSKVRRADVAWALALLAATIVQFTDIAEEHPAIGGLAVLVILVGLFRITVEYVRLARRRLRAYADRRDAPPEECP